jgi:hypothetical protein
VGSATVRKTEHPSTAPHVALARDGPPAGEAVKLRRMNQRVRPEVAGPMTGSVKSGVGVSAGRTFVPFPIFGI